MNIFVLMPFRDEFDDVHHIIKDAAKQVSESKGTGINCFRADEMSEPGRISDQILDAIRAADLVVADLTGNNPNVMYELGYAHALAVPTVILNQNVGDAPFDVQDFRQITYDRSKLVRECRPAIVASISAALSRVRRTEESAEQQDGQTDPNRQTTESVGATETDYLLPGSELTAVLQTMYLKMRLLRSQKEDQRLAQEGERLLQVLGRVTVVGRQNREDLSNTVAIAGNCAVQLELRKQYALAETIFRKGLGLFPDHAGLHIQYSDFLIDRGRLPEAQVEFQRARELDATDSRIQSLQAKLMSATGEYSEDYVAAIRDAFERDPGDRRAAVAYLVYLSGIGASAEQYETVCNRWAIASDDPYPARRTLADFLAKSRDAAHRDRAVVMYRDMLQALRGEERADVLHNVATLVAGRGDQRAARGHWAEAYAMKPDDHAIRASFSQLLAIMDENELALRVASGEKLQVADFALPDRATS